LRRIILLVLSSILLSGLLSAGIFIFVAQRLYADMRAAELLPIAREVAAMTASSTQAGPMFGRGNNSFGATLHIYDSSGASVMTDRGALGDAGPGWHPDDGSRADGSGDPAAGGGGPVADGGDPATSGGSYSPANGGGPVADGGDPATSGGSYSPAAGGNAMLSEPDALALIAADLPAAMSGAEVTAIRQSSAGEAYLVVGVGVEGGGAVFFTKPLSELNAALSGLNLTLLISTLAAFAIMLAPAYLVARWLVIPIRQMRDVAHAMSDGDFSGRADESVRGELGELAASINHFVEESQSLEQMRSDYVANVSHELRTPIASIRAMGETLRDGMAKTEEKRELFYNNIVRESLRLSRLVDDLLELSRLQAGIESMPRSRFDLREVVRNIEDGYGHLIEDAALSFSIQADMSAPIMVLSNADRIEQVLVVLMDNAIKHSPAAGAITLALSLEGGKVTVSVDSDTGEMIPPEEIPLLFERFYKADKSRSGTGTGLGLSIAKEIVQSLGEGISASSDAEKTRFWFTVSMC
jgi:signal transduction histidine kinase